MEENMTDPTEAMRRALIETGEPEQVLAEATERWTTEELQRDFEVIGFMAPYVAVIRKNDGTKGSLMFTHSPRFYFNFVPDTRP
jgi:hypothetical protein